MSAFVNDYAVLSAVKAILDGDAALDDLLDRTGAASKVILGVERPEYSHLPTVHLSVLTKEIAPEQDKLNQLVLRVAWFVNAKASAGKTEDVEALANIGERIYDLLDEQRLAISGYNVMRTFATSQMSIARDMILPEGLDNHFQSLLFTLLIARSS